MPNNNDPPLHLQEFYRLLDGCSDELQKHIYSISIRLLRAPEKTMAEFLPSNKDDVLEALRKEQALKGKTVRELTGTPESTREELNSIFLDLNHRRVEISFLVISLVRVLDDTFARKNSGSDEDAIGQMEQVMQQFEKQKREDSVENAGRHDEMIEFCKTLIAGIPVAKANARQMYDEWRKVFGERADMPAVMGLWADLAERAVREQ